MFESLKTGSARRPQRPVAHGTDALRRVQSCCRTLVVASVLCVAAAMPSLAAVVDLGSGTVEAGPSHGGDAPLRTF